MANNFKNNVFDHVFYEFEMYLHTFILLHHGEISICAKGIPPNKQLGYNLSFEGHQHYARNSIEFFSCKKGKNDDLHYHKILSNNACIDLDYNLDKCNGKYIDTQIGIIMDIFNKGVSHLTGYRTKSGLDDETTTAINDLFCGNKNIIRLPKKILDFLYLLEPKNLVQNLQITIGQEQSNHDLFDELADDEIQKRLRGLKELLIKLGINKQ